jgi:membrane-bound metal-dependent hydrolase YbcI (DUF457 family)
MATFGHLAAGIALSRYAGGTSTRLRDASLLAIAASLPDVDFVLPGGHRELTHSVGFALIVGAGVAAGLIALRTTHAVRLGLLSTAAVISHVLLDVLTAAEPVPAAWPLWQQELHLPFRLLPATPPNESLLSPMGALQFVGELAWSGVLVAWGLWRASRD